MSRTKTTNPNQFAVRLGARGRVVLPAPARRELGLEEGSRLILTIEAAGQLRLTSARVAAAGARGILRRRAEGRSLADELTAERRKEARDE